jgi:hypothetical protein
MEKGSSIVGEPRMQLQVVGSAHLAQAKLTDDMTELSPTKSQARKTSITELSIKLSVTKNYKNLQIRIPKY